MIEQVWPLVTALFAALAILLFFMGLSRAVGAEQETVVSRLGQYTQRGYQEEPSSQDRERRLPPIITVVERAIAHQSFAGRMATGLARADLKLTVTEWLLFRAASSLLGLGVGFLLTRDLLGLLGGLVIGFIFPTVYLRLRQGQRLRAFNNQLGDTVVLLANSLRSGYSLFQSLETISSELSPPIADEFHRVVREIGLGLSTEEALDNLLRRIKSEDLDLMITAIKVQNEVGGNLAEILETIGYTIRERVRLQGEIRALTALQRGTGAILTLLPLGVAAVLYVINRPYMSGLFEDRQCGWPMLGFSILGVITGGLLIRRISQIEV